MVNEKPGNNSEASMSSKYEFNEDTKSKTKVKNLFSKGSGNKGKKQVY